MENGKKVTNIQWYTCGYCENYLKFIDIKLPFQKKKFYAKALSFEYNGKYHLFDTGYSRKVLENGFFSKIYHFLNPTKITEEDEIIHQLQVEISTVFISHLHPDHIGGLPFFPHQTIVLSENSYQLLQKKNPLVFRNLIPKDLEKRVHILKDEKTTFLCEFFEEVYDYFGDGSVYLIALEGHMSGQYGIFFPEHRLFCVADASWHLKYDERSMSFPARKVQQNYAQYVKTLASIRKFKETGIKIVTSH